MTKIETEKLFFITFCIEQYKKIKGLSGADTEKLFSKRGVTDYLNDNYDVLHTQDAKWILEEIDEFLKEK